MAKARGLPKKTLKFHSEKEEKVKHKKLTTNTIEKKEIIEVKEDNV